MKIKENLEGFFPQIFCFAPHFLLMDSFWALMKQKQDAFVVFPPNLTFEGV